MVDPRSFRRLIYRLLFIFIALLALFQQLLPLDLSPDAWPRPDVVLLFAFAWVLRRPNFIPVFLAALVFLLNDLLLFRPPGLWAAISVVGLEFLRSRAVTMKGQTLVFEWVLVGAVLIMMAILNRVILGAALVAQQSLSADIVFLVGNLVAYPIVVLLSVYVLRIRPNVLTDDPDADYLT